jgi:hypothetical protein
MASSPSPPRTTKRQKKLDHHQPVKFLSLHNSKICFDGKKIASNDAERQKIAEFESALKKMNVSDMFLQEQTTLIKNYNLCHQRLNNDTEPDLEQILGIVSDWWAPKTDLICLYVRWAKKLRSNFHLDSIATLLTLSKQCDYLAYVLLEDNGMSEIMECFSCLVRPCSLLRPTISSWTILSNHVEYPSMDSCSENSRTLVNKRQMNALMNAVLSERRNWKHTINIIYKKKTATMMIMTMTMAEDSTLVEVAMTTMMMGTIMMLATEE